MNIVYVLGVWTIVACAVGLLMGRMISFDAKVPVRVRSARTGDRRRKALHQNQLHRPTPQL